MTEPDDEEYKKYNEKVTKMGSWIDKNFLKDVIDNTLDDEVYILDFKLRAAVSAGENYMSIIYKTTVTFKNLVSGEPQVKNIIIKGMPDGELFQEIIHEAGLFNKEITIYNECFPILKRNIRRYFPKGTPNMFPDSYVCSRPNTLVMEDLGADGFIMANRHDQFDFEHADIVLRTVARYHALTHKLHRDDPDLVERVATEIYTNGGDRFFLTMLTQSLREFESVAETWDEVDKYLPAMRKIHKGFTEKMLEMVKPTDGFNVMTHGDLWLNNMMFKYNDDEAVARAKLVDFQVSRYCSPALDLHYFFFTSVKPKVLSYKLFELVDIYHSALLEDCSTLHMEIDYPIEQLHNDLRNTTTFAYMSIVQLLPMVLAPAREAVNLESNEGENSFAASFQNPHFRRNFGQLMPFLDSIGYLNDAITRMRFVEEVDEKEQPAVVLKEELMEERENSAIYQSDENDLFSKFWRFITQPVCN